MASVKIEDGTLEGTESDGVFAWLGVPYAAPPVGALRWQPPQPVVPWFGVRRADRYGPEALQHLPPVAGAPDRSEDCLYLNIWAPARPVSAGLPVMVFIHGGGFVVGSGAVPAYRGAALARRGVVLVTINYRLGRFGFFAHPALTRENPAGPLGNYGILDQIAALQWVRRNIAAFGGDPENVTLFGESAGGMSVNYLMRADAARGLFHRAAAQSAPSRTKLQSLAEAESLGTRWAAEWSATGEDPTALRAVSADEVLGEAQLPGRPGGPMIDGRVIPEQPLDAFQAGRIAHVPYLTGFNSFELGFFPGMEAGTAAKFGDEWPSVAKRYDPTGTREASIVEALVVSDHVFVGSTRAFARAAAAAGLPTFLYHFNWLRPAQRGKVPGAVHADELYPVFDTMGDVITRGGPREENDPAAMRDIVEAMQKRWVAFAATGQPDDWPSFRVGDEKLLEFTQDGTEVRQDFLKDRLDFIDAALAGKS